MSIKTLFKVSISFSVTDARTPVSPLDDPRKEADGPAEKDLERNLFSSASHASTARKTSSLFLQWLP
jgi:hypothetical protein